MMMIIVPTSREHKGEKEWEEVKSNADYYGGMVQPSQQHVAPCVKVVERGFGTRKGTNEKFLTQVWGI